MRLVAAAERRARLVNRHRLDGGADDVADVVRSLVALHATDPASVVLSVLARCRTASIADVVAATAQHRALVRWMAMRRTLFVFAREDVPTVQAAVSTPLAAALRRRLITRIERNGIDPSIEGDVGAWVRAVERRVEAAMPELGSATGAGLRAAVPALGATIAARTASEVPQSVTSSLLTLMGTEGRLVRATPVGAWTTRNHRWEPVSTWWPEGLPELDRDAAQADLARRWLARFGPASSLDLEWWTGWNRTTTRAALAAIETEPVDLDGTPGVDLPGTDAAPARPPAACLLPALDPTPMGWQDRHWYTAVDPAPLYDRAGNIGPTVWWDGEIVGGWAVTAGGVRTRLLADRGREAADAVNAAAAALHARLEGAVVVPAARTPLERELSGAG